MRIRRNEDTESFLKRCRRNLSLDGCNAFLDHRLTKENELRMKRKLQKAGAREFSGEEKNWPSLFLDTDAWERTPYHQTVTLKHIQDDSFSYDRMTMLGGRLFSLEAVQNDPDRELGDWLKLRAMDRDFEAAVLYQDDEMWMLDAPSEAATNDPPAMRAFGNAVTFGLGIGYYLFMALRNPAVVSVTAVEKSEAVIRMFERFLLPQFPHRERIRLIHGDAMDCWNEAFLSQYDSIYADIWQSNEDGLFRMNDLLERFHPRDELTDFWIEDSCMVSLRTIVFLHFEELLYETKREVNEDYRILLEKTRQYFHKQEMTVEDSGILKEFLYSRRVLRAILGEQL